jgi:ATP adenylyltransferase
MKTKKAKPGKAAPKKSQKKSALPAKLTKNLTQDIWPLERDLMIRPDRYKYVRKLVKDEGCVFCNASQKKVGFETLCLYQTKHSMVLINKYPYNSGHI